MTDSKDRRIDVLLGWRDQALARGFRVPSASDLRKIGAAGELWPPFVDVVAAEPWRATIAFLFKQVRFGVPDPVANLPEDLFEPAEPSGLPAAAPASVAEVVPAPADATTSIQAIPTPATRSPATHTPAAPGPSAPTGGATVSQFADRPRDDPRLAALLAWREQAVARNPSLGPLRDATLRRIVSSGSRTPEAIRGFFPPSWAALAPEAAAALATVEGGAQAAAPALDATTVPVATSGGPSRWTTAPVAAEGLGDLSFAVYAFTSTSATPPLPIRYAPADGGGTLLTWPAAEDGETVVYRVVSGDGAVPYSPDDADVIAVTAANSVVDERPFTTAVRYVQVWRHSGPTTAHAAGGQPVLHAATAVVATVQRAELVVDQRKVIGNWAVLRGATRVQVHRIPVEEAARVLRPDSPPNESYRILASEPSLRGFVDITAERGRSYVYQMWVAAETDDGTVFSLPVVKRVEVPALLVPVTDLVVSPTDDGDAFDLSWTMPLGSEVDVYRTPQPPDSDAFAATYDDASALQSVGLSDDDRLKHPVESWSGGRSGMTGVSWPHEWVRAYFTPVTKLGGKVRLGTCVPAVRMHRVRDAKIVERTTRQVVTFAWPEGAASVLVYDGPPNVPLEALRARPRGEISRLQYVRQGGLHLFEPLPPRGCVVHLVPVAFSAAERVEGAPATVAYPGLYRLWYRLTHRRGEVTIEVAAQFNMAYRPAFALVHRPDRLPLAISDGQLLQTVARGGGAQGGPRMVPPRLRAQPGEVSWTATVPERGYLRVFVEPSHLDGVAVALIDPPVSTLRLGGGPGR